MTALAILRQLKLRRKTTGLPTIRQESRIDLGGATQSKGGNLVRVWGRISSIYIASRIFCVMLTTGRSDDEHSAQKGVRRVRQR